MYDVCIFLVVCVSLTQKGSLAAQIQQVTTSIILSIVERYYFACPLLCAGLSALGSTRQSSLIYGHLNWDKIRYPATFTITPLPPSADRAGSRVIFNRCPWVALPNKMPPCWRCCVPAAAMAGEGCRGCCQPSCFRAGVAHGSSTWQAGSGFMVSAVFSLGQCHRPGTTGRLCLWVTAGRH